MWFYLSPLVSALISFGLACVLVWIYGKETSKNPKVEIVAGTLLMVPACVFILMSVILTVLFLIRLTV